jgi:hypothetical protein
LDVLRSKWKEANAPVIPDGFKILWVGQKEESEFKGRGTPLILGRKSEGLNGRKLNDFPNVA